MQRNRTLARAARDQCSVAAKVVQGEEVEEFWALKDVNFEVQQADHVIWSSLVVTAGGTLISPVLSCLTVTPTSKGRVRAAWKCLSSFGRLASLILELSRTRKHFSQRREILGMRRSEIRQEV